MAIKDISKKPFVEDRDEKVFIGIDLPFRKSDGRDGWFASTIDTISSVKNNIRNLIQTYQGERYMQPNLGVNLRKYLFEPFSDDVVLTIQNELIEGFQYWLPFVEIRNIEVKLNSDGSNSNKLDISLEFNIKQDPNTLESVQISVTE
jgi:phage baseplate assembly protein W